MIVTLLYVLQLLIGVNKTKIQSFKDYRKFKSLVKKNGGHNPSNLKSLELPNCIGTLGGSCGANTCHKSGRKWLLRVQNGRLKVGTQLVPDRESFSLTLPNRVSYCYEVKVRQETLAQVNSRWSRSCFVESFPSPFSFERVCLNSQINENVFVTNTVFTYSIDKEAEWTDY